MNRLYPDKYLLDYNTGQFTISELAKKYGISTGKMYYVLRDIGCVFTKKRRKEVTQEERERRSKVHKGKHISEEQRRKISEKNSCNYNGLNGWGHTKRLKNGYILGYAPKHPKAHKDGYVLLHRMVAEHQMGRYLLDNETVHHINHVRDDNRTSNLLVMDKKEHMSMHMKERNSMKRGNDLLTAL